MGISQTMESWISANVEKLSDSECWNAPNKSGNKKGWHVRFRVNSKKILAHRAAWILSYGEIPDGLFVLHKCDNPKCCNPKHLFLGTQSDNAKDMWTKGRGVVSDSKGRKLGASIQRKLSNEDVMKIFELFKNGITQKSIGSQFSVTDVVISNILKGKTYPEYKNERDSISHLLGRGTKNKLAASTREIYKRIAFI